MRKWILTFVILVLGLSIAILAMADSKADKKKDPGNDVKKQERVYPIAAGVWYPTDGPIPEHPMRYYRVRCWPGCHSGSSYGMYPDSTLSEKPIFPTSTIDRMDKKGKK